MRLRALALGRFGVRVEVEDDIFGFVGRPCGEACLRSLGRDLSGSMCVWRKELALWYMATWRRFCVGDVVGRSRIRRAAMSYCVKESRSRLRTRVASDSCDG